MLSLANSDTLYFRLCICLNKLSIKHFVRFTDYTKQIYKLNRSLLPLLRLLGFVIFAASSVSDFAFEND